MRTPPPLLTLIASHVGSERRLTLLNTAIDSALRETDEVWVSVSWALDVDLVIPDRPGLRVFRRAFGRCSQAVHWMMLGYALPPEAATVVVLLDDDDQFLPGAGAVLAAAVRSNEPVAVASDVSGTVMHRGTFLDLLRGYGHDPTYPMADTLLFKNVRYLNRNDVVFNSIHHSADSTWVRVAAKYGRRA